MKCKNIVFAVLLGILSANAHALTLSDLLTQSRLFLRDTATDPLRQRFSDTQLTYFLNNCQKETNLRTWAVVNSSAITLTPGTTEYSLPSDHIAILRVTVNQTPIVERTFSFLDDSNYNWISDSGVPVEYYVRVDSSIVTGVSRESIGLHPISTFTALMVVQYLAQPPDLVVGGDVPFAGNNRLYPFHHALAFYAAYQGFLCISEMDDALVYYKRYEDEVALMEGTIKTSLTFNPSFRGGFIGKQAVAEKQ